jgi:hypothetical protein
MLRGAISIEIARESQEELNLPFLSLAPYIKSFVCGIITTPISEANAI